MEDFILSSQALTLNGDEILISEKHDIVVALEPNQIEQYSDLKDFIVEISRSIPNFDNLTQDYYETMSDDIDFPYNLSVVYFEGNKVILDYWSEQVNNQFDIVFTRHASSWKLVSWNGKDIPSH